MLESTGPEFEALHAALSQLHRRILYEPLGIEYIGYDQVLFDLAVRVHENRTLADQLVWILAAGGELRAVQCLAGENTGPTLSREELRARWEGLDQGDLAAVHESEAVAIRVLNGLFGLNK